MTDIGKPLTGNYAHSAVERYRIGRIDGHHDAVPAHHIYVDGEALFRRISDAQVWLRRVLEVAKTTRAAAVGWPFVRVKGANLLLDVLT